MSRLMAALLTPDAHAAWQRVQHRLRRELRAGPLATLLCSCAFVFALLFLRLEGPAWQGALRTYGGWFAHLHRRPYRPADPLRYVIQAAWLCCVMPARDATDGRAGWLVRTSAAAVRALRRWGRQAAQALYRRLARTPSGETPNRRPARPCPPWVLGLLAALATVLILFVVVQPFNDQAQFIFVSLLFAVALVVRKIPGRVSLLVLMVLSVVISTRYIWWRYTATLNWMDPTDSIFGLLLLLAETYSWTVLLLGYLQLAWPLRRKPVPLPTDTSRWPTVDVYIPTYNEDLSVVRPTVYAALGIDWPADKLRIYLLDDGRREAFRALAESLGIGYIVRPDNQHAKAGNLNHALQRTDGELIAIFDCDHIPVRSFLQVGTGAFLKDPKLALVQLPHHFFSPDPFERNLGHFARQPNENTLFYGLVQDGNDLWNAAFFCGSCAVLRRSALESIGGFTVETVTEDAHTALRLHRAGYNSAYLHIPQAAGLATESLSAHVGQRIRWARGMIQIFRLDNPLLGRGLSFFQRLCYLNAMLHFLSGVPRLIYLLSPLAFLLFHSYIVYAPGIAILLNVVPHLLHANLTNSVVQGSYRRTLWGEIYETVLAWYIARPTTVALLAPHKGKFNVTAKGGLIERQFYDWSIARPYLLLALANLVGLGFGVWRLATGPQNEVLTVVITMVWVAFNLIILGGAIAVAAELRQIRHSPRVPVSLPVSLAFEDGHRLAAVTADYSEGGVGVTLTQPRALATQTRVDLCVPMGQREFVFSARVDRCQGDRLGLRLDPMNLQQQIEFVQCTYARADAWLGWQRKLQVDRPMLSLLGILRLGLGGYVKVACTASFPIGNLARTGTASVAWLGSFIPVMRRPAPDLLVSSESLHGVPLSRAA